MLYGAATSSHQVEGYNVHNDWWAWERANSKVESSGAAADHYNRYAEDFALAKSLGHNAHRLSLEWSRIEPAAGEWNKKEIEHYKKVLYECKKNHLKVFLTLHHFTNPLWLAKIRGWENRETPKLFQNYATKMAYELGEFVDFWVTINEPMVYTTQSFWHKRWPPQKGSFLAMWRVINNLARAHNLVYTAIKNDNEKNQVGIAKHMIAYLNGNKIGNWWFNDRFLSKIKNHQDFIGVNYYFSKDGKKWDGKVSDMDWPIRPEGLAHVLKHVKKYNKPVYVTENGLADAEDKHRPDFIRDHLKAVKRAQADGVDVRGYLHWSLLDNFEWDHGFGPRFGLVEVDYKTQERRPRKSAYVYKALIEEDM